VTDDFEGSRCKVCGAVCTTPAGVVHHLCLECWSQHHPGDCELCAALARCSSEAGL
jgi:hypothetical protein